MSEFVLENKQDIDDFLIGCAFFGTGGGGAVEVGKKALYESLEKGHRLTAIDPKDIDPDGIYCSAFFMGSIAPKTEATLKEMEMNGYRERKYSATEMLVNAVRGLEKYVGKKITGLMVVELGGSNSACCMAAAYALGLPIIDGDPAGRAIPEAIHGLPAINGFECTPAVCFDSWGNSNITTYAFNYAAAERIGKMLSEASYGELAEAAYPVAGRDVHRMLVPNTLTQSLSVGRVIRQARERGANPCKEAAAAAGGKFLVSGKITDVSTYDSQGYYWGTYTVTGSDGGEYKIWIKNENHILWKDGVALAGSPDIIVLLETADGTPVNNTYLKKDMEVSIVLVPAREQYLTENALKVFSPRGFGFDFDYVPFSG